MRFFCHKCPILNFVCFGGDSSSLRTRFIEHECDIFSSKQDPVSEYFNMPGHSLEDLVLKGTEIVQDTIVRRQKLT